MQQNNIPPTTLPTFHSFNATMTARLSAAFIIQSFPALQPFNQDVANLLYPELVFFMDSIIHHVDLPYSISFSALCLLHRLRVYLVGWSNHELFFIAFIVALKILCDNSHSNQEWSEFICGLFTHKEINEMERAFCHYMRWNFAIGHINLHNFTMYVWTEFNTFV